MASMRKIVTFLLNALQIDLVAVGVIVFMPQIVKTTGLPVYLMEPMRVLTLIALAHTGKINALVLAIGLPLLGFFSEGHPAEIKAGIMATELTINVLIFYALYSRIPAIWALPLAIIVAKGIYYLLKWAAVSIALLPPPIMATPISYQLAVLVIMSLYVWWYLKK
ncbi:MAG: hypothetical protein ACP5O2_02005 [Bacteroidales bacterium]